MQRGVLFKKSSLYPHWSGTGIGDFSWINELRFRTQTNKQKASLRKYANQPNTAFYKHFQCISLVCYNPPSLVVYIIFIYDI